MGDSIRDNGVVGCGGAGFPAAVKLSAKAETVIVNAAECEPLLHKDKELCLHKTSELLAGLSIAMLRTGAKAGVIGIKEKHSDLIDALSSKLPTSVSIQALRDVYPAGDEFTLVHDITRRIIPPGGLPLAVNAVVLNVETLVNIGASRPVTQKTLTVAGAVKKPLTVTVPLGVSIRHVIDLAGGPVCAEFDAIIGGVMMGRPALSMDEPVTKTMGGVIVLPQDHSLVSRHRRTKKHVERIARSACDQCSFCTELCPRYLLGHPIEPHKVMRALAFSTESPSLIAGALFCCECGLCSLISCPEDLDPKNVCAEAKKTARSKGLSWKGNPSEIKLHPLAEHRRTPMSRLFQKLDLSRFDLDAPLVEAKLDPGSVVLPLFQHLGDPSFPVVRVGDKVKEGDLVAEIPDGKLGARIHASISGVVRKVENEIVIER